MEEGCSGEKKGRDGGDAGVLANGYEFGEEKIRRGVETGGRGGNGMGIMAAVGAGDSADGEEGGGKSVFDMKIGVRIG